MTKRISERRFLQNEKIKSSKELYEDIKDYVENFDENADNGPWFVCTERDDPTYGYGDAEVESESPIIFIQTTDDYLNMNGIDLDDKDIAEIWFSHPIAEVMFMSGKYIAYGMDNIGDDEEMRKPQRVMWEGFSVEEFKEDFHDMIGSYFSACAEWSK